MSFHTRRVRRATGSYSGNGEGRVHKTPRVAIAFDLAMFERIAGEAERRKLPFAEIVREKVASAYQRAGEAD